MLTFGSLFAGIGGFDLGFERAGLTCSWQVEIDPFCQRVLARHWPHVRRHDDVRTFPPADPEEWRVDVVCGGFPCQDISSSGPKVGIGGERSGLWVEYARAVRTLRPRWVVVENVADLVRRGLDRVLGDLAGMGFDAWWGCVPSAAFGSPQRRFRTLVVAHDDGRGQQGGTERNCRWTDHFRRLDADGLAVAERAAATAASRVRRMGGRVPGGVDKQRIASLGNSFDPLVAEWVGRQLLAAEAGIGKARCVLTNPAERTIIGVLEDRTKKTVLAHFEQMPDRDKVKVVTMDMARSRRPALSA